MKCAVITFPGSNCDHDAIYAAKLNNFNVINVWHEDTSLPSNTDCVIVPGGFSYGDYLRCGAIARFAPIMQDIVKFANKGGHVIGICNGFQILTETGLLPGVLLKNSSLTFICKDIYLNVANNSTSFTNQYLKNEAIKIPIAHFDGNYYADEKTINQLESENRVVFRYANKNGEVTNEANPNGSINNIAGIINEKGNVLGMMPHPERYSDIIVGGNDGAKLFQSLLSICN